MTPARRFGVCVRGGGVFSNGDALHTGPWWHWMCVLLFPAPCVADEVLRCLGPKCICALLFHRFTCGRLLLLV